MSYKILDYTEQNGLVFCQNPNKAENNAEILYISEVKKLKAHAVFFRRFYKDNAEKPYHSEPAVCIFRERDIPFNSPAHIKLHAALWSAGKNEIYIIHGQTRTDIINARKPAKVDKNNKPIIDGDLILANNAIKALDEKQFSAYLFSTGTFWEQTEFEGQLVEDNSPYRYLLKYLMDVRKEFLNPKKFKLDASTTDKLLVICILVKFLEEIDDENGKHALHDIYKKYGVKSFAEAVRFGFCMLILNELANEFNGKIFDKFSIEEKVKIRSTDLTLLADFLRADVDIKTGQLFIWEQYSFKHLPAEVISAIYENFIQEDAKRNDGKIEKGIVYTPIHLVNFLVDEVMPLNEPELFSKMRFRIFDGSCGSGVFLVAAYKRLLQWWAINHSSEGKIIYPNCEVAQKILEDNIFGVDVKETAVLVSIFGLTTALLDKLTPKEIWNNLKFKDLSENNIQQNNFFAWAAKAKKDGQVFDLAIGNPPFNVENGKKVKDVLDATLLEAIDFKHKVIPNNNFALHFFEGSMSLSKKSCLIIPSNVILYNKEKTASNYRRQIFANFSIEKIFDFTHLRRSLFHKTADTPVVALIVKNTPPENKFVEHVIVKRLISTEKNIRFEIDDYDRHKVRWNWAIDENKQFVWKTNLLGGGRLFHLIYRLSLLDNLKYFISNKERSENWVYNNGYIGQYGDIEQNEQAVFLNGQYRIKPKTFDEFGNFEKELIPETEYFWNKRSKELFQGPHIIFKLVVENSTIPMAFVDEDLCFNSSFVGIAAPKEERKHLHKIYERLFKDKKISNLYRAFILATSSKAVVYHETSLVKEDIDSLPYPEDSGYLCATQTEEIIIDDVLNYYRHLGKAISKNSDGAILHQKVSTIQMKDYGDVFCNTLNEIYAKNNKSWQLGKVYQTSQYSICQFGFGKNGGLKIEYLDDLDQEIKSLVQNEIGNRGAVFTRITRIFKHIKGYDCVYFIKPHALRYWLKSIALRDADDTFTTFKKAGF